MSFNKTSDADSIQPRDYGKGGRGISPYPPADRGALTQIRVPRRIASQVKAYAERLAWESAENE